MACLIDHGRRWDLEIVDSRMQVASTRAGARFDRAESVALLTFAELIAEEVGHQATTYSDPRAQQPRMQVALQGRRLRRRPEGKDAVVVLVLMAVLMLAPPVIGWIFDRLW